MCGAAKEKSKGRVGGAQPEILQFCKTPHKSNNNIFTKAKSSSADSTSTLRNSTPQYKSVTITERKLRSQTSDLWTDAATVVRRVREEQESEKSKRESGERR